MCGLSLAWVTSENSTSNSNADIFWLNLLRCSWTLSSLLLSPESGVDCPCPWFHANSVCCPVANCSRPGPVVNCLPAPLSSQLSFASPYHFRIRRDFRSKNPLSGFAPKQTKESSALAGHPYSATKVKEAKCDFCMNKIKYLGHIIEKDGRRPDPERATAIKHIPAPDNVTTLQSFLGLANYYQSFIKNLHDLRALLNELSGDGRLNVKQHLTKLKRH